MQGNRETPVAALRFINFRTREDARAYIEPSISLLRSGRGPELGRNFEDDAASVFAVAGRPTGLRSTVKVIETIYR